MKTQKIQKTQEVCTEPQEPQVCPGCGKVHDQETGEPRERRPDDITFQLLSPPYSTWGGNPQLEQFMYAMGIIPREEQAAATFFNTAKGKLVGLHFCPCHGFNYTIEAIRELIKSAPDVKILTCFPKIAKERYPDLAPFIVGDWDVATHSWTRPIKQEDGFDAGLNWERYELVVDDNPEMTVESVRLEHERDGYKEINEIGFLIP